MLSKFKKVNFFIFIFLFKYLILIFLYNSLFLILTYANADNQEFYKLVQINIYGNKYLEKVEILDYLNIKVGKFYDIDFYLNIEQKLRSWGYFSYVNVNFELLEENNVSIEINLIENKVVKSIILKINECKIDGFIKNFKSKINKPFNPIFLEDDLKHLSNLKYFSNINVDIEEKEDFLNIYINLKRKGNISFGLFLYDSIGGTIFYESPILLSSFFIGIYSKIYFKRTFSELNYYNNSFNMPFSIGYFCGFELLKNFYVFNYFEWFFDNATLNDLKSKGDFLYGFFYFNNKKIQFGENAISFSIYNKLTLNNNILGLDIIDKFKFKKWYFLFSLEFLYIIKSDFEVERIYNLTLRNQFIFLTNSKYLKIPFFLSDLSKTNLKFFTDFYFNKYLIYTKNTVLYNIVKFYFVNLYSGVFFEDLFYKWFDIKIFGINLTINFSILNFNSDIIIKYGFYDLNFENVFFTLNFFPVSIFF